MGSDCGSFLGGAGVESAAWAGPADHDWLEVMVNFVPILKRQDLQWPREVVVVHLSE
jgi:hypothetical protein